MSTDDRPVSGPSSNSLWILIPTYNDWEALSVVLQALRDAAPGIGRPIKVLVVDDGSTVSPRTPPLAAPGPLERIDILHLRRNLGHQRAIAVGLAYLVENQRGAGVVVMDGDGQDRATDITRLLDAMPNGEEAVFAARQRRPEGMVFALFYHLYRFAHRILTGIGVRMGNFSYLPWRHADRLVVCSELWSHYAAAVVHSRIPYRLIPCERGERVMGRSKMNPVALVAHGLSAMAVFADRVGVRALAASGAALALGMLALVVVLTLKWSTTLALPGWATMAGGLLIVFMAQIVLLSTLFTFVVLAGRSQTAVIPLRDYRLFVREIVAVP